jgi:hypothetical protein
MNVNQKRWLRTMKNVQLKILDAHNFVYQMINIISGSKYMYDSQIKGLIDYTKHYYKTEASDEQLTYLFKNAISNLGW